MAWYEEHLGVPENEATSSSRRAGTRSGRPSPRTCRTTGRPTSSGWSTSPSPTSTGCAPSCAGRGRGRREDRGAEGHRPVRLGGRPGGEPFRAGNPRRSGRGHARRVGEPRSACPRRSSKITTDVRHQRVGRKIFATQWDDEHTNVMLDEGGIRTAVNAHPPVDASLSGGASGSRRWGRPAPRRPEPARRLAARRVGRQRATPSRPPTSAGARRRGSGRPAASPPTSSRRRTGGRAAPRAGTGRRRRLLRDSAHRVDEVVEPLGAPSRSARSSGPRARRAGSRSSAGGSRSP